MRLLQGQSDRNQTTGRKLQVGQFDSQSGLGCADRKMNARLYLDPKN